MKKTLYYIIGTVEKKNLRITTRRPKNPCEPFDTRENAERYIFWLYFMRD